VFKYCEIQKTPQFVIIKKLKSAFDRLLLVPLPKWIFTKVTEECPLFPPTYDDHFLNQLQGIGPKIRHLIAEAGYHQLIGPAVDCHMIRFTCCMGSGCPLLLNGGESFSELLKQVYLAKDFPSLNEVPASIAQLLRTREHSNLITALEQVATSLDMVDELHSFTNHYPPQKTVEKNI
jgi:hypothetical protein